MFAANLYAHYISPVLLEMRIVKYQKNSGIIFSEKHFVKDRIFRTPVPGIEKVSDYNLILFTFEGLSARFLGCYGGKYPGLTPYFDAFAKQGTIVHNYYNHLAATVCGVPGQDGSFFPRSNEDASLPTFGMTRILRNAGWNTSFFFSKEHTGNFKKILGNCGYEYIHEVGDMQSSNADEYLFSQLLAYLKEKEYTKEKFFANIYNIQTHAYFKHPADNHYGNGMNQILNAVHNLDAQFGKLLAWLDQSGLAKNTIVAVTADHAAYPNNPPYAKLIKNEPDKPESFTDRIPLIIRHPKLNLDHLLANTSYDAPVRSSISLAPTMLHLLGIQNHKNAFLGNSLFEQGSSYDKFSMHGGWQMNVFLIKNKNEISPFSLDIQILSKLYAYTMLRKNGSFAFPVNNH